MLFVMLLATVLKLAGEKPRDPRRVTATRCSSTIFALPCASDGMYAKKRCIYQCGTWYLVMQRVDCYRRAEYNIMLVVE